MLAAFKVALARWTSCWLLLFLIHPSRASRSVLWFILFCSSLMIDCRGETPRHRGGWMGVLAGVAVLAGMPLLLGAEAKAEEPIDQAIDRFASHLLQL